MISRDPRRLGPKPLPRGASGGHTGSVRGPVLVVGVLLLAGAARAQTRLVAPVELALSPACGPASLGSAATLTPAGLSPLMPAALTTASGVPVLSAPSIVTPIRAALARLIPKAPVETPMSRVPWTFKLKDSDFYYHGTTLEDLARVVESGGEMAPEVSQYSIRSADSIMYAKGRREKVGLPDNPAVLLQFRYDDLSPLVSADAFKGDVLAAAQMSFFSLHSAYAAAVKPVPLSLMTPESKESLLAFLRAQEAERPGEPKWKALREKFERVLAAR